MLSPGMVLTFVLLSWGILAVTGQVCDRTYAEVNCGMPNLRRSSLPTHASEAIPGEFPWHVAIYQIEHNIPIYSCGGSLLNGRFVLTAAHCVINANNGYPLGTQFLRVHLGYHQLDVSIEGCTQQIGVQQVHVHPEFESGVYRHDIALVELNATAIFNDRVLPVCLESHAKDAISFYEQAGKIAGWGYTEFDEVSDWLRMTDLPLVNYTTCLNSNTAVFSQTIHDGMFCAGYTNGTSVCNGDSGGGFVMSNAGRWELEGIVSFTALREGHMAMCDTKQFAGFTKVRYYRSWIDGVLKNERKSDRLVASANCGTRKINKVNLIVNGVRSTAGEWPWHASVFEVAKRSREYLCGGTLISEDCILTAASCVQHIHRKKHLIVQLGQNDLWQSSIHTREVRVADVELNEASGMALLKLADTVRYDDFIQPICLPTGFSTDTDSYIGKDGMIAGYGQTEPTGRESPVLQSASMPIVDSGMCVVYRIFQQHDRHRMFCTGYGNGTNACKGDEGGGFYAEENGVWSIMGVISKINIYRKQCDPYGYLGLSNVMYHLEWILERIRNAMMPLQPAEATPERACSRKKCNRRHKHKKHRRGSGESGSNESNESRERSIATGIKGVIKSKVDLVKDIHSAAGSAITKIFG